MSEVIHLLASHPAIALVDPSTVMWGGVLKIFSFILLAPLFGMLGAMIFTTIIIRLFRQTHPDSEFHPFPAFSCLVIFKKSLCNMIVMQRWYFCNTPLIPEKFS